jgi:cytochrome c553
MLALRCGCGKPSAWIRAIPWWNDPVKRRRLAAGWVAAALACSGLALGPAATVAAPALIEDSLAQRLAACTTCHGREGRAAADGYHPRIAGKPAGYLLNQLRSFRDGRRGYGPMVALVAGLPDAYLAEMAGHFAAQSPPYPAPAAAAEPAATLARGRALALQGDAARGLPACTACHGAALTGVQPATPGLLGLPRDYLAGQLGAWLSGQRRAQVPDCMATVVSRLGPGDVAAVSAWLASQAVPETAKAAASLAAPAPLRCGSAADAVR